MAAVFCIVLVCNAIPFSYSNTVSLVGDFFVRHNNVSYFSYKMKYKNKKV